ncbi:MAG: site-specific DNA-methyltransferase [Ignavibacteria bacterium]|jgi:site-specific DNA-methyltransferase (adenine-specific)|nr:site-specific DNA-methyltransferase [Ignavibacteria bacterium]
MEELLNIIIKDISKTNNVAESIVYQDKEFYLFKSNSLDLLPQLPDNCIDMIFADPPYMLSNDGVTCYAGKMVSVNKGDWDKSSGFDSDFNFHQRWISECKRILKPEGTIWISGTYHSIYICGFILQKEAFHILNDITWYKPNAAPNLSRTVFAASHENLIWARKDKNSRHVFNYELMKSGSFNEDIFKNEKKQMRSVWAINSPKPSEKIFGKHPTQKPLDLLKRIIISSTKEKSIILDPFSGGGTTGIAAQEIGNRAYIGIEIEQEYIDLTVKRLKHLQKNFSLGYQV